MVKLANTLDLGSSAFGLAGSTPARGTTIMNTKKTATDLFRSADLCVTVKEARMNRKTRRHDLTVEIDTHGGLTFETLDKVAKLFETKRINVGARHYQGCPTCGGETCVVLEILDARVGGVEPP
jgi:hypothetical protein